MRPQLFWDSIKLESNEQFTLTGHDERKHYFARMIIDSSSGDGYLSQHQHEKSGMRSTNITFSVKLKGVAHLSKVKSKVEKCSFLNLYIQRICRDPRPVDTVVQLNCWNIPFRMM